MKSNIKKHIKPIRLKGLPEGMRQLLKAARLNRNLSQAELGQRLGLPQMHISGIETGKIIPRFDTLLDLVRVLDYDLLLTPRSFVPAVQALIRDQGREAEERPLYANNEEPEEQERSRHDEV
jgi:transcriptional regulator with XRE-family HTH domain